MFSIGWRLVKSSTRSRSPSPSRRRRGSPSTGCWRSAEERTMGRSWKAAEISSFITSIVSRLKPSVGSILALGVGDGDLAPMLMDKFRGASLRGIDHDQTRLGLIEGRLGFYEGRVDLH